MKQTDSVPILSFGTVEMSGIETASLRSARVADMAAPVLARGVGPRK